MKNKKLTALLAALLALAVAFTLVLSGCTSDKGGEDDTKPKTEDTGKDNPPAPVDVKASLTDSWLTTMEMTAADMGLGEDDGETVFNMVCRLELAEDGSLSMEIDQKSFESEVKTFFEKMFKEAAAEMECTPDEFAAALEYASFDEMIEDMLKEMMAEFKNDDSASILDGTWEKVSDTELVFVTDGEEETMKFVLDGDSLKLTDEDEEEMNFTREK